MLIKRAGKIAAVTVIALSIIGGTPNIGGAYAAPAITVQLDDVPLQFDAAPRVDKGVTYVPFRTVGEALGIDITWNSKSQTVKATNIVKGQTTEVLLQVGSTTATVNGKKLLFLQHPFSGRDACSFH